MADAIERARASLAAARVTAERVRLANVEAMVAVERSRELLRTLGGCGSGSPAWPASRPATGSAKLSLRLGPSRRGLGVLERHPHDDGGGLLLVRLVNDDVACRSSSPWRSQCSVRR